MKTKKHFKTMFFQKWGTFANETLVCVGVTKKEIRRFMVAKNCKPELIEKFDRGLNTDGKFAFVWTPPNSGATLLWLGGWIGDAEDMDTLVHETNHLIYDISRDKGFQNEPEIQAYQQAYLFSHIWKELKNRRKKFGVKSSKTGGPHANSSVAQRVAREVPCVQSRFDRE
jgi:hypothetical protein